MAGTTRSARTTAIWGWGFRRTRTRPSPSGPIRAASRRISRWTATTGPRRSAASAWWRRSATAARTSTWRRSAGRSGCGRGPWDGRAQSRRGFPALRAQRILPLLRARDQRTGIDELLDLLPSIRKCNDEFVIVAVHLAPDLVQQPRVL